MKWIAILLVTAVMGFGSLLGWNNVYAYFQTWGETLNPRAVTIYGGTTSNPERVPSFRIGESRSFEIDGHVVVDTPLGGRLCAGWTNVAVARTTPQATTFYPDKSDTGVLSIRIRPAGPPCSSYESS